MYEHERSRCRGDPKQHRRVVRRAAVREQAERIDHELEAEDCRNGSVNHPNTVLALLAACGQAVEQPEPDEIAGGLRMAGKRIAGQDRADPGPAGGDGEAGEKQPVARQADRSDTPDQQRKECGSAERMAPEGNQRVHARRPVNSADMPGGVAKFYK